MQILTFALGMIETLGISAALALGDVMLKAGWVTLVFQGFGIWQGMYEEVPSRWLRWYDSMGNWVLTEAEQLQRQLA